MQYSIKYKAKYHQDLSLHILDNPGHPQGIRIYPPRNVQKPFISNHSYTPSSSSSSSVICQTTGPKPLPKRFLHIVRSKASPFNLHYPLLSFRSSSNFLRLLRLLLTSIWSFIFTSITCCRRQFLRKM